MSRTDPQIKLRLPPLLKARIEIAADSNKRSMNAEILSALEDAFMDLYDPNIFQVELKKLLFKIQKRRQDLVLNEKLIESLVPENTFQNDLYNEIRKALNVLYKFENQIDTLNKTAQALNVRMNKIQRVKDEMSNPYETISLAPSLSEIQNLVSNLNQDEILEFDKKIKANWESNENIDLMRELLFFVNKKKNRHSVDNISDSSSKNPAKK